MAKLKVLVRIADNAQIPFNSHLAKNKNEFREMFIDTDAPESNVMDGNTAAIISGLRQEIENLKRENATLIFQIALRADSAMANGSEIEAPQDGPETPEETPGEIADEDELDPDGTVGGKLFSDWTKVGLLDYALEFHNVDLPNRDKKAVIFLAIQKLEAK